MQTLAIGLQVEFEESATLVTRFPTWNVTCRWLPGMGLTGMICSCHSPICEHRRRPCWRIRWPKDSVASSRKRGPGSFEPGRRGTRAEVLVSVGVVLREMVSLGLARACRPRRRIGLRTLAVSAHGVDLPRLERMLRVLADEVETDPARDAQAISGNLLATASGSKPCEWPWPHPLPAFVGVHRSRYEKSATSNSSVWGLANGATPQRLCRGDCLFLGSDLKGWVTWSESRPVTVAGFNAVDRYRQDGPWTGCVRRRSEPACHSPDARLAQSAGRLSGRPSTRCQPLRATNVNEVPPPITSWLALLNGRPGFLAAVCTSGTNRMKSSWFSPSNGDLLISIR